MPQPAPRASTPPPGPPPSALGPSLPPAADSGDSSRPHSYPGRFVALVVTRPSDVIDGSYVWGMIANMCLGSHPIRKTSSTTLTDEVQKNKKRTGSNININPTQILKLAKKDKLTKIKDSKDEEQTQFVKDFLKGNIRKELFKLASTAIYFTYSALEEEMECNKDHPAFAPLYFPMELHRKEALTKDMEYVFGEDWEEKELCSEASQKYMEWIHYLGQNEPELLVAHAYTCYMGDISGGQVLKQVAQWALKLPSTGEGTQFYLFENVDNAQQFKQLYRARMNALDLNLKTKERIVEEDNRAFEYSKQILDEMDHAGSMLARETREDGLPVHDGKGEVCKCRYYAAKPDRGAVEGSSCPFQTALAVLSKPSLQFFLVTGVALVAGLLAWYYM
ncbi:LOW QUALITY PROTEIN: heme oxygenase 2-like [Mustela lutreola]|uniref:LOW QUALITY PROTEIN: heme oxygenase 2-like n=1 Tax=Mustela lutreola TaxID=9666 RepID=UPI00279729D0|nr:LOW QUALITY PROTEIN: heme oxygenase 2-like [Mustela lutreola]